MLPGFQLTLPSVVCAVGAGLCSITSKIADDSGRIAISIAARSRLANDREVVDCRSTACYVSIGPLAIGGQKVPLIFEEDSPGTTSTSTPAG